MLLVVLAAVAVIVAVVVLSPPPPPSDGGEPPIRADVYASPTCGCCHLYIQYLTANGFEVRVTNIDDLAPIKAQYGVPEEMGSCHTTVIEGYFVEGHVPVEAIRKLLSERPNIRGIALPGMPAGSPGMGGEKTGAFVVFAISDEGITEFMRV